jgi:predicted nuclease of restriction endonuclease-like (RecB) superfamily
MAKKKSSALATSGSSPPADDYGQLLETLKHRVRQAQTKAMLSVNRELIRLYWDIGCEIVLRQERMGWGKSVVDRLAVDLQKAFPGVGGFSASNVSRMRAFYQAYRDDPISAQPVPKLVRKKSPRLVPKSPNHPVGSASSIAADEIKSAPQMQIPWGHNVILLFKLTSREERLWYAAKTLEHGWSRAILTVHIEQDLFGRQGKAITDFADRLPAPQSDLAQQALKDPYLFDFLTLHDDAVERDLETGLIDHIQKFLIELGAGFAFVGRQVHFVVGEDDFYVDLLFYHLKLRAFVVIDLKMKKFTPEDAGKMNFYLSTVDSQMSHANDAPTIGLILCKTRDRVIAEYALRDMAKPIGVAEWQTKLVQSLPEPLKGSLPSIAEIEAELAKEMS